MPAAPAPLPPAESKPVEPQASARLNTPSVPPPPQLTPQAQPAQVPPQPPPHRASEEAAAPGSAKSRAKPIALTVVGLILVGALVGGVSLLGGRGPEAADGGEVAAGATTTTSPRTTTTWAPPTTGIATTSTSSTTTSVAEPENGAVLLVDSEVSPSECSVEGGLLRVRSDETYRFYSQDGDVEANIAEGEYAVVTEAGDIITLTLSPKVELGAGINPDEADYSLTATDGDGKELWSVDARYAAPVDANAARQLHFVPGGLVDDLLVGQFVTEESPSGGYPGVVSLKDGSLLWSDPDGSFGGVASGVMDVDGTLRDLATGNELPLQDTYDGYEQVDDFVIPLGGYGSTAVVSASTGAVQFEVEGANSGNADGVTKNVVFSMSGEEGGFVRAYAMKGGAEVWTIPAKTVTASGFSIESVGWGQVMGRTDKDFAVIDAGKGEQIKTFDAEQITWINDETNVELKLAGSRSELDNNGRDNLFTGTRHLLCSPYPQIVATDVPVIGVNAETGENLLSPLPK